MNDTTEGTGAPHVIAKRRIGGGREGTVFYSVGPRRESEWEKGVRELKRLTEPNLLAAMLEAKLATLVLRIDDHNSPASLYGTLEITVPGELAEDDGFDLLGLLVEEARDVEPPDDEADEADEDAIVGRAAKTTEEGELRWWNGCACKIGPLDREIVHDSNLTPRCPRCRHPLGGDPTVEPPADEDDEDDETEPPPIREEDVKELRAEAMTWIDRIDDLAVQYGNLVKEREALEERIATLRAEQSNLCAWSSRLGPAGAALKSIDGRLGALIGMFSLARTETLLEAILLELQGSHRVGDR